MGFSPDERPQSVVNYKLHGFFAIESFLDKMVVLCAKYVVERAGLCHCKAIGRFRRQSMRATNTSHMPENFLQKEGELQPQWRLFPMPVSDACKYRRWRASERGTGNIPSPSRCSANSQPLPCRASRRGSLDVSKEQEDMCWRRRRCGQAFMLSRRQTASAG